MQKASEFMQGNYHFDAQDPSRVTTKIDHSSGSDKVISVH